MLEWLLKYPPALYREGTVQLAWHWPVFAGSVLAIAVVVLALTRWWAGVGDGTGREGTWRVWVIGGLRCALIAMLIFLVADPVLLVTRPEPVPARVAVLLDDSLSMDIADVAGQQRHAVMLEQFAPGEGNVARALEDRFDVRYFRYGENGREMLAADEMTFSQARSDLAGALAEQVGASEVVRPAAIVVVGDGDTGNGLHTALSSARARGVEVYTVGIGAERFEKDLEISEVRLPVRVLRDERFDAELSIQHRGYAGETVRVAVDTGGVLLDEVQVELPGEDQPLNLRVPVVLDVSGPHRLAFRLQRLDGELVVANNSVERVVDVSEVPLDVLHVEGEPRFEVKFLRRALAEDGNLRLASLVRTAENKYLRLGVGDESELAGGFPTSAEDLFRYHALVLGSLEAAALSAEQHDLIRDFVARRGGGLLVLGGRSALAEGGYAETPLVSLLPVRLEPAESRFLASLEVRPANTAGRDPILQLDPERATPWENLPALTVVNPVRRAKPGATVSLVGTDRTARDWIVLARHRYGRGRVAVLPVRDSWRWQMHASIPADDLTHELFWRQMLRWLVRDAGGRVRMAPPPSWLVPGDRAELEVTALDSAFRATHAGEVRLNIVTPPGDIVRLDTRRAPGQDVRRASYVPDSPGVYELEAEFVENGLLAGRERRLLEVRAQGDELFGAELQRGALQHVAAQTGGRYFDVDAAEALPEAISVDAQGEPVARRLPLWDAPLLLLALLAMAATEWLLRRRWRRV